MGPFAKRRIRCKGEDKFRMMYTCKRSFLDKTTSRTAKASKIRCKYSGSVDVWPKSQISISSVSQTVRESARERLFRIGRNKTVGERPVTQSAEEAHDRRWQNGT